MYNDNHHDEMLDLQGDHVFGVYLDLDEHDVISDVIQLVKHRQLTKLLCAKAGIALARGTTKKRAILLDGVWLDRVGDVLPSRRILTLIEQGERYSMAERPGQQGIVVTSEYTDEQ